MIPIFKLMSLIIRLFTKPLTNYLKASLKTSQIEKPLIRETIVGLGQRYHRWNVMITRSFSGMGGTDYIKPLTDEKALDSGAEFIGELLAYGTLLTWGIYEVNRLGRDTKLKEAKTIESIQKIGKETNDLGEKYKALLEKVNQMREELEKQKEDNK